MRKYFLFSGITLIGLTTIFLIYISIFGIKTNNFNKFINDKLKDYDSRLSLKLNDDLACISVLLVGIFLPRT